MIRASVGVGASPSAYRAGSEAVTQALSGLPDGKANILFVFGAITYDQDKLIAGVESAAPGALVIGCSTAGEISSEGFSTERSVVVLAIVSDQMQFWGGVGDHILWNATQAGEECANTLEYESRGYISSVLYWMDILSGNGEETLRGALGRLAASTPVWGGAAGDDLLFFETYQYLRDKAYKGAIVGVGLSGDYHAAGVLRHGFLPIGIARYVTRSKGTTLYELDGKPAASMYEDYFGPEYFAELHKGLLPSLATTYPLGVFLPDRKEMILRNPVFVDRHGAMTFTAGIPEGSEVRLMISDTERGLEVAREAAREVLKRLGGRTPKAVLIINSIARKKMFGLRADDEIRAIQEIFGRDVPIAGFYGYTEIAGVAGEGAPIHNGSLLLWALAE